MLTATADMPRLAAVRAAPTVPEWRVTLPVFSPGLMPEATRSGTGPKARRCAANTHVAGGASSS